MSRLAKVPDSQNVSSLRQEGLLRGWVPHRPRGLRIPALGLCQVLLAPGPQDTPGTRTAAVPSAADTLTLGTKGPSSPQGVGMLCVRGEKAR